VSRYDAELMGLQFEAERLVRAGESRAEVSRRLGVSPQTLAGWALRGGWRKKDLALEHNREITTRTLLAIRKGNRAVNAEQAMRTRMVAFMREAVELLAAGDEGSMRELDRRLSGLPAVGKLEAPKVELASEAPDARLGGLGEGRLPEEWEQEREAGATEEWGPESG
jgi:hypothetical protein